MRTRTRPVDIVYRGVRNPSLHCRSPALSKLKSEIYRRWESALGNINQGRVCSVLEMRDIAGSEILSKLLTRYLYFGKRRHQLR